MLHLHHRSTFFKNTFLLLVCHGRFVCLFVLLLVKDMLWLASYVVVASIVYLGCLSCTANQLAHQSYVKQILFSNSFERAERKALTPFLYRQGHQKLDISKRISRNLTQFKWNGNTKDNLNTFSSVCDFIHFSAI